MLPKGQMQIPLYTGQPHLVTCYSIRCMSDLVSSYIHNGCLKRKVA